MTGYGDIIRIHIIKDRSTCGEAWQVGVDQTETDWVCCLADDLCPRKPFWWLGALQMWSEGHVPVPLIWTQPSGEIESAGVWRKHFDHNTVVPMTTIPFCETSFWKGRYIMPNIHYRSDILFSEWCMGEGREPRVCEGFEWDHWWGQPGRQANPYE